MPNDPIFRPIRAEEAPEAKRIIASIAHAMMEPQMRYEDFMVQWEGRGIFKDLDDIQHFYADGVFCVVEIDGRIVGTGAFRRYRQGMYFAPGGELRSDDARLENGEGLCEVRRIALLPEYRGQKLAYTLMRNLIHHAREMGFTRMVLWTNPVKLHRAVDFYRQLGFQDLAIDGLNEDELWMGMDISSPHPPFFV